MYFFYRIITKLITFDATGTILLFRVHPPEKYVQIAKKYGIDPNPEIIKDNFKKAWFTLNTEHPNFGRDTGLGWRNWWTKFVGLTFQTYTAFQNKSLMEKMTDDMLKFYTSKEAFDIRNGTEELLNHLKGKGFNLGVISNYDPRLHCILDLLGLKKYFNFVLTSYEFGYKKPNREIFEEALKLGGCNFGGEGMHIGDDIELDFFAAKNVGMKAIYITKNFDEIKDKKFEKNEVFDDFLKLKQLF